MRLDVRHLLVLMLLTVIPLPAQAAVSVRGGDHPGFSRIVFDFDRPPHYAAAIEGDRLEIRFDGSFAFDLASLKADPPQRISHPAIDGDGTETVVSFTVRPGLLRHFTTDGKLVVDLVDAPSANGAGSPETSAPARASVASGGDGDAGAAPAPATAPREGAATPPPATAEAVRVSAEIDGDDLLLAYHWDTETAAAVFARAGYLWVVFEKRRVVDHSALDLSPGSFVGERLRSLDVRESPHHSVLRYRLRDDLHVAARRDGTIWRIRLTPAETRPRLTIEAVVQPSPAGPRLFISGGEVGAGIRLHDPEVGDDIDVVPFGESGHGNTAVQRYVQFALLPSAQGLVVENHDSDVLVTRQKGGVAIAGESGLLLSRSSLDGGGDASSADAASKLVDFAAWRRGGRRDFVRNEHALLVRLSRATPAERRQARWDLARFYLAHGAAADAIGPLELMREVDADLERNAPWLAVHAVTLLRLGRAGQALSELLDPSLDAEPEMWLWRGLAAEAAGKNADALAYFEQGREALAGASRDLAIPSQFALARAALAESDLEEAARAIAALQSYPLAAEKGLAVDYLYGRLAEARGDLGTARARFEDAAGALDRSLSAHARFDLVKLELRENNISPAEAIAMLERLRFAWRGDEFEQDVLDLLARLYIDRKKYREGLETYRQAAIIAADTPRGRKIARKMSDIFTKLYLEGAADDMSPVVALALFYDFRELTPLGAEGDRMIRHLVDRLVAVDLLDRAAELLEHQVNYRLEGAAQAIVAVRLAKIYLLDDKPDKALGILRATRQTVLPRDVSNERRLVEARALIELKRYEEALVLIEDERSREADTLRADAYWESQDWPRLVATAERLLGTRWQKQQPLSEEERQHVIREAIALSFLDRRQALLRLRERYRPLLNSGALAGVFDVLTSDDPPPAGELARIAGELSQSARFRSFLAAYRAEFTSPAADGGAATNAS